MIARITTYLKENYWLIGILLLASFLRIYHLDFQSIWLDEIHTMKESDPSLTLRQFNDVIVFREGMGHLYFFMVRIMHLLFGYSSFSARLLSALIGIASVYVLYLLGREVYNKKAGLVAALLLSVNLYQIFYSQEARPYALLVLFALLSLYRLSIFLKNPSVRNAVYYGIFTGLMVNAHLAAIIAIGGQGLLILFLMYITPREERKGYFKNSVIAGLTAFVFMLPTYRIFLKLTKYHSGWLELPGPKGFTNIYNEFIGNTELLSFIFLLLVIIYFTSVFRQKDFSLSRENVLGNKLIFSLIFLFSWIFISIPVTTLKSYLDEPMIMSRYYIHLQPALLLLIAIGAVLIKNRISMVIVLGTIVILALTDVFVVKKYYHEISKTQYRELVPEIRQSNTEGHKVVSAYGWLYSYFFDKDKPVEEKTFESYIQGMQEGSISKESFWYMDGNHRPYQLNDADIQYLEENFILKESLEKYDTWAKHYIVKQ